MIKRYKKPFWVRIMWFRQVSVWIWPMGHYAGRTMSGLVWQDEATVLIEYIAINLNGRHVSISTGKSTEVRIGIYPPKSNIWVTQYVALVLTVTAGPGKIMFLQLTNVGTHELVLNYGAPLA